MLHARLTVDLPSEALPRSGVIVRLLRTMFVESPPEGDQERLVGDALELLAAALGALATAGFDDVIAVQGGAVQGGERAIYADTQERTADLEAALERIAASGRVRPGFGSLRAVLSRRADGLHTLVELSLAERVPTGQPELTLALVSRLHELRPGPDEGPRQYRARVDARLAEGRLDAAREQVRAQTERLAHALSEGLGDAAVRSEGPWIRVVAPGPVQVGRFRHLGFGRQRRAPVYRPDPRGSRSPAYDHPHVHHYFDPYHDLLCLLVVEALLDGRCSTPGVEVVDPEGTRLFTSDAVPSSPALPVPRDAVTLEDDGLVVDDAIPSVGLDRAEAGSPHTPGFAGEGTG